MQTLKMKNELLPTFLESLKHWGNLWAPIERKKGAFSLEPIDDVSRARPDALRTVVPFKKLLLKPRFAMMSSGPQNVAVESNDNDRGPMVFFGAHPCDIHALKILDTLYLSDFLDPYYQENREQLTVVAHGCWPDDRCFCQSMDTSAVDGGFDLFLTPLEGRYLVTVGTSRGDDIIRRTPELFEEAGRSDIRAYIQRHTERREAFQLNLDVTDLPYILTLKKHDPVWDEVGKKCICCGSCSMVCPTCSCFNVVDEIGIDGNAERVRYWDSCLYRDYAMVAGGHNFRADRADRVKNRYYHKQEAFVREFGMPSCVGCGRCIDSCPTGINVVEVFQAVRGAL